MVRREIVIFLLLAASGLSSNAFAQAVLEGRVTSEGHPVPLANVGVAGTPYGAAAGQDGMYRITGVPPGRHRVIASAVGFRTKEMQVTLADGATATLNFELEETVIEGEEVVVTGTLLETYVKDSPVKVDVVTSGFLQKMPNSNIMEAIEGVNGLQEQIDCGVCGTNNIRINGMDGPYTAVLIDGMPIMSSLATVYGLNGISPALIRQIEVIKGPMSTLYGTEALAGVINIITKTPRTAPRFSFNAFGTNHGEYAVDFGVVPSRGKIAGLVSGTAAYNDTYVDENGDGFADITLSKRISLFGRTSFGEVLNLSARVYYEDRIGGTREFIRSFSDALRGSDELYGETILTNRLEMMGSYQPAAGLRIEFAANDHRQDSFYGSQSYNARQSTLFGQILWHREMGGKHSVLGGAAVRMQRYDDNTGSTGFYDEAGALLENMPDNRIIPGLFAQHEARFSSRTRLLTGMRVDYQRDHGIILSPRLSVKAGPSDLTTFRLNAGTGFRVVNLFTEDHAAYTGSRATVILEDLEPERSYSGTLSVQQVIPMGGSPFTIDVDAFYTYFTNKIEPDYSNPGEIRYANLRGSAVTRGLSLTFSQNFAALPLTYSAGATWMDVFRTSDGIRSPIEFAPDFQATASATLRISHHWSADYTVTATGPMRMPQYTPPFERPPTSPTYSIHNLQILHERHHDRIGEIHFYAAARNLFDYVQPSPLIDPARPFGDHFDTTYVYGPIRGRNFGFGIRVIVP